MKYVAPSVFGFRSFWSRKSKTLALLGLETAEARTEMHNAATEMTVEYCILEMLDGLSKDSVHPPFIYLCFESTNLGCVE